MSNWVTSVVESHGLLAVLLLMFLVESTQEIEVFPLVLGSDSARWLQIQNGRTSRPQGQSP